MCERVPLDGGGYAIVCRAGRTSGGRAKPLGTCQVCHFKKAEVLCDGPEPAHRKTCDLPMCRSCAKHEEPNRDFCPQHDAPEKRRLSL